MMALMPLDVQPAQDDAPNGDAQRDDKDAGTGRRIARQ
jgi:hypothetical protein